MEKINETLEKSEIIYSSFINQERYNEAMKGYLDNIKDPNEIEIMQYIFTVKGGNCIFCKIAWIEKEFNNIYAKYKYFIPGCDCIDKKEREKKYKRLEDIFNRRANIPSKYHYCTLRDMDKNTSQSVIDTILQSENYIKEKKYYQKGLIIYGDIGTGKTHITIAVMKALFIKSRKKGIFIHTSDFITNIIKSKNDYIKKILMKDVILLDDIDKAHTGNKNSKWIDEQFFSLINGLTSNNKIILGTCNIKTIADFNEVFNMAIVSRLMESCLFIKISGDDYRLKK